LLQRLGERHPRWKAPDSPWVVRLVRNYRSHPEILKLLSSTRYDDSLIPCADPALVRKFESLEVLPCPGFPILFIGVRGTQQMDLGNENQHCLSRPDAAHSYYNPEEALAVLNFVSRLLQKTGDDQEVSVSPDDIGVVCSFRRQVQKIRGLLRNNGFDAIRVGTVEDYQGQEERILVISTTLSDPGHAASVQELDPCTSSSTISGPARTECADALEACIRARLERQEAMNGGPWPLDQRRTATLLGNVRRFTVALSRAQCMLVVIGSPEVLETSPHWRSFLAYVAQRNSLSGELPSKQFLDLVRVRAHPTESKDVSEKEAAHDIGKECAEEALSKRVVGLQSSVTELSGEVSMLAAALRRCEADKQELLDQLGRVERQRKDDANDLICIICLDARKEVVFFPCGHVATCRNCFLQVVSREAPSCPVCRQGVHSHFFVYI